MNKIVKFENFIIEHKFWGKSISEFLNWLKDKSQEDLIFIDTETTGLRGPKLEQLTQISAICANYDFEKNILKETAHFDKKIKLSEETRSQFNQPGSRIKWVLSFNNYGKSGQKYFTEDYTLLDFYDWVSSFDSSIFVIQNAEFDMKMLNVKSPTKFKNEVIDTKQIIQLFYLPIIQKLAETDQYYQNLTNEIGKSDRDNGLISSSMSKIGPALKIDMTNYHDTLSDCRIMMQMFCKIIDFLKQHQSVDISKYQAERIMTKRR